MTFKQTLKFCLSQKGYANFQGRASVSFGGLRCLFLWPILYFFQLILYLYLNLKMILFYLALSIYAY